MKEVLTRKEEFDRTIESIERDLDMDRCAAAVPRLLEICGSDLLARTKVYLLAARCYFVGRDVERYLAMIEEARLAAAEGPIEARVRVAAIEASLLTSAINIPESVVKLEFAIEHLPEVSDEVRSLVMSIRGRNDALMGRYAEALEYSQEAISLAHRLSSTASFANGTMALVFQFMGRIEESEHYGLEQIRILSERGSLNWVASTYSFLSSGAASIQQWERAHQYAVKATELMTNTQRQSSIRVLSLLWVADSHFALGEYEAALEYASTALAVAMEEDNARFIANSQILLGQVHLKMGNNSLALETLLTPLERDSELLDNERMYLYRWLAATYKALDRKAEAFDICYRLWELQTDFDRRTREALLGYHKALEKKIHFQEIALLKTKSDAIARELSLKTMNLAAQTDLLARFRDELRVVIRNVGDPGAALSQVKEKLKALPCEQIDWTKFETQFTSVHPEFRRSLAEKFPTLTQQELRLCQLLRVGMKSFEAARLMCISERGVENHRFNIRKKLELTREQSLTDFLTALI
ncbi:MAG: tetratricopeptide repeat protein [Bacteroidota bacterium]|nr:tetratricopeptide repeat protein [Bacteroidota bacterium]MDP4232028.1 tetratricopeptide repeat protein [Bacteroidota bacterium]MDP4241265.1 tetratricopeptide repeat protein [Bacteroidota bacterium]